MEPANSDDAASIPFRKRLPLPPALRVPLWAGALIGVSVCAGLVTGALEEVTLPRRLAHAAFLGAGFGYLATALIDFAEHFRLEKLHSGRYTSFDVIPLGESLNHAATVGVVAGVLALSRPLPSVLEPRDWFVLASPLVFLALGWRDEFVYHRRRSVHREDLMHTVAHLAAGAMLAAWAVLART